MKTNYLLILAAIFGLWSCGNKAADTFTVNGTVGYDDCDGAMVLIQYNGEKDTAFVSGNAFSFTKEFKGSEIASVFVRDSLKRNLSCYFVVEPCTLEMTLGEDGCSCTGSELNEANNAYEQMKKAIMDERLAAFKAINENAELTDEQKKDAKKEANEKCSDAFDSLTATIFTDHQNDALGADAMMDLAGAGREVFDSLYAIAGENVKNSRQVKKELARYECLDNTAVGKMFTDFTVENGTVEGGKVSLSDYVGKGKYVLVDFWASWCGPCRGEMPFIADVYEKYKGDQFEVVGVAVWDKREDTEKILPSLPITWPIIYDAQQEPTNIYGIRGIPHLILFGPDGTILERGIRGKGIEEALAKYLK